MHFQWDAYRQLVDRFPVCTGGVCQGEGCLPRVGVYLWSQRAVCHTHPWDQWYTPPCGQTDTCENITFANFVCGRQKLLKTIELGDFIENLFEGFVHSARTVSTIPLIESSYNSRCEIPGKHYDI